MPPKKKNPKNRLLPGQQKLDRYHFKSLKTTSSAIAATGKLDIHSADISSAETPPSVGPAERTVALDANEQEEHASENKITPLVSEFDLPSMETFPSVQSVQKAAAFEGDEVEEDVFGDKATQLLREFDLNPDYGPCMGVPRVDRWVRAESLGMNPPNEILHILSSQEEHSEMWRKLNTSCLDYASAIYDNEY